MYGNLVITLVVCVVNGADRECVKRVTLDKVIGITREEAIGYVSLFKENNRKLPNTSVHYIWSPESIDLG